jgi:hypothetical protein
MMANLFEFLQQMTYDNNNTVTGHLPKSKRERGIEECQPLRERTSSV